MGSGTRVACGSCQTVWDFCDGLLFAITDDGEWVVCPHPGERSAAEHILGKGNDSLWRNPRLRSMSCALCIACREIGYYSWSWRGIDAAANSDLQPGLADGELQGLEGPLRDLRSLLPFIPANRIRRCLPCECVSCGRWRPWLLWPSWIVELLLAPMVVLAYGKGRGIAPLRCPRCHTRGMRIESWIS